MATPHFNRIALKQCNMTQLLTRCIYIAVVCSAHSSRCRMRRCNECPLSLLWWLFRSYAVSEFRSDAQWRYKAVQNFKRRKTCSRFYGCCVTHTLSCWCCCICYKLFEPDAHVLAVLLGCQSSCEFFKIVSCSTICLLFSAVFSFSAPRDCEMRVLLSLRSQLSISNWSIYRSFCEFGLCIFSFSLVNCVCAKWRKHWKRNVWIDVRCVSTTY